MLRLRPTKPSELGYVLAIEFENSAFLTPWSRQRHQQAIDDPDEAHWLVLDAESERPLGFVLLAGLSSPHHSVELRRIVVADQGKGVGRAALRLVIHRVFGEPGAHRLWLDVKDFNGRARKLYVSEGFVEEGRLRDAVLGHDGYESLIVMSILEQDHRALRVRPAP